MDNQPNMNQCCLVQNEDTCRLPNSIAPMLLMQTEDVAGCQHGAVDGGVGINSNISECEKDSRKIRFCAKRLRVELEVLF